ncbi:Hypothetical protein AJAP_42425 (plasmid) [Amycolatopsis japonica]|uniref:Nuclease associated modular domain-containing protein n=1 Tax=Amycolatopsis japonica TaxID=208439 RepID=A0A075VAA1_9PSEU|nr:NUMOD3 domain-containing DNA-binding protein [Amycolatopsis japonica]AIG81256.1 Hypothetical protein AJAP_42425 [Amycolatopsis japonica]
MTRTYHLTPAGRAKLAEAARQRNRARKGKSHKGHPLSAETKAKISAALKAYWEKKRRTAGTKPKRPRDPNARARSRNARGRHDGTATRRRRPARHGAVSHAGKRHGTRRVKRGSHHAQQYRLISARSYRKRTRVVIKHRMRRTRIVVRRRVPHHRVWKPPKKTRHKKRRGRKT